jgi:hypothetical protein
MSTDVIRLQIKLRTILSVLQKVNFCEFVRSHVLNLFKCMLYVKFCLMYEEG